MPGWDSVASGWIFGRSSGARLVARRDLLDAAGDLRLSLAMVGLALAIPLAAAIGIRGLASFGGVGSIVERLTIVGAFFVVFLPASFSLVLALESFVGERERTTLEVLLSTPLKESEIYAGKVASVLLISLALCFGGLAVYSVAMFSGLGYFPIAILGSLAVSTICQVAAMVAGAVIVSASARTMRAANVMASFIILPMSVVLQLEAALILVGRGDLLWGFAALMAVVAAVLLRMGLAGFNRESMLARETGSSRPLRRAASAVAAAFKGRPSLPRLLLLRRWPLAIAGLGFPVGGLVGYLVAAGGGLPGAVLRPVAGRLLSVAGGPGTPTALTFFEHNAAALLLAALLAPVTAGLSGFALTFLPGFVLGYAAALSSWALVLAGLFPHGLIEIPVAIIAGGLLIQLGAATIHLEPEGGWARRITESAADYVRALAWLVPALLLAAILETHGGNVPFPP
jgi:uncharacterized membrane protein SpoIIM required for sporulation